MALHEEDSVEPDTAFEAAWELWLRSEATVAFDALKEDPSRAVANDDVRARFQGKWFGRETTPTG